MENQEYNCRYCVGTAIPVFVGSVVTSHLTVDVKPKREPHLIVRCKTCHCSWEIEQTGKNA